MAEGAYFIIVAGSYILLRADPASSHRLNKGSCIIALNISFIYAAGGNEPDAAKGSRQRLHGG